MYLPVSGRGGGGGGWGASRDEYSLHQVFFSKLMLAYLLVPSNQGTGVIGEGCNRDYFKFNIMPVLLCVLGITVGAVCVYPARVKEAVECLKAAGIAYIPVASGMVLLTITSIDR